MQLHRAFADIDAFSTGLAHFHATHHRYPTTAEGLTALTPAFVRRISRDPWGNEYAYRSMAIESYALYSAGADELDEGGLGDDVTTRQKKYDSRTYGISTANAALFLLLASTMAGLAHGVVKMRRA